MGTTIRALAAGDVESVRSVERAAGARFREVGMPEVAEDEPAPPAELERVAAHGRGWVAVDEHDEPIGYVVVDRVDDAVHIEQLSVHPEHQGHGLGRALVDRAAIWGQDHGVSALTLTTFAEVPWNRPLYERLGFRVLAEGELGDGLRSVRTRESELGLDPALRVCMRRDLSPVAPSLVIFDCDGVLVDSERLSVRIEVQLLGEMGWPVTEAEVLERFVGRSDEHMVAAIEAQLGRPVPEFLPTYRERLFHAFDRELAPVEGVVGALDHLDGVGLPTCVASSGTHDKMARTLGRTGLLERFAGRIFSATQVERGKPAPDLFLFAAASMGVAPSRCLVVEDSRAGVAAARAAGMRSVGYAGGLTPRGWLEGPDTVVIDDMSELAGLVERG